MVKAVYIPSDTDADVEVREVAGIEDIQAAVGGWFEPVDVPALGVTIYINEEGRVRRPSFNSRASFLWWYYVPRDRPAMLVGDVIIVGTPNKSGDDTDVLEPVLRLLTEEQDIAVLLKIAGGPLDVVPPSNILAGIVLPLTHGDPRWLLSAAHYDELWSAMCWAKVLQSRLHVIEETKVVPLAEIPDRLRHAFPESPRKN